MPQVPTARGIKIRSASDAHLLFYAVHLQKLPIIQRRLDATERLEVAPGAVFVWEERSAATTGTSKMEPDAGPAAGVISGIERWTDGLKWGPSRVRDDFLFYQEKDSSADTTLSPPTISHSHPYRKSQARQPDLLVKQTYSVHYYPQIIDGNLPAEPARKWHLTAYQSAAPGSTERLADVHNVPELQGLLPPEGLFRKARIGKKRDGQQPLQSGSYHHHHHHHSVAAAGTTSSSMYPLEPYGGVHHNGTSSHGHGHGHGYRNGNDHAASESYDTGGPHVRGGSIPSPAWRDTSGSEMVGPPRALLPPPSHNAGPDGYSGPASSNGYSTAHNTPPVGYHNPSGPFTQGHYQPPPPPPPPSHDHAHSNSRHSHSGSVGYGEPQSPYAQTHGSVYGGGPPAYPVYPHRDVGYNQRQETEYNGPVGENQGSPSSSHVMRNPGDQSQHFHPHPHLSSNGANGYEPFHSSNGHAQPQHGHAPPPTQSPPQDGLGHVRHPQHAYSYSNGHSIPEPPPHSHHDTPQMQHARVDSQPYPHTPQQRPMMPHTHSQGGGPLDHSRAFSQPSHSISGTMEDMRTPPMGVVRIRRGARKSEDNTPFRHALSRSPPPPSHGMNGAGAIRPAGSGVIGGEGGRSHFSPYSRPLNAPGPRQHPAVGTHHQPEVNSTLPPFENHYNLRATNGSYSQQDPLNNLDMRPSSNSNPFATPSVPTIPAPPDQHHYPPPLPPSLPRARTSQPPQSSAPTYYFPSGAATHDEGVATGCEPPPFTAHEYGRNGWSHVPGPNAASSLPPPRPASLQMHSPFPFPAGSMPTSRITSEAQHHTNGSDTSRSDNVVGIPSVPIGASFSGHITPHPNPNSSPLLSQFQPVSTSLGSNRSGSGSRGGGGGLMNGSPELAGLHQHMAAAAAAAAATNGSWDGSGPNVRGETPVPPRLDTSINGVDSSPISVTAGGSASGSASSKLGPLTPSTTLVNRDPEDERLLDLLSRGLLGTAGARAGGDGNVIASGGPLEEDSSAKNDG